MDITSLCRLAPNIPNRVEVSWTNPDALKVPSVGVYVFQKVSVQTLVAKLKSSCVKKSEFSRSMVREKLQITDSDFEIETNTLKVSLMCPLMKFRIQLPGRAFNCKHVQCFDLESYLMMNEKKPTWNCPVCDQNTPYENLIIDGLYQEILSQVTDCEEVQFAPDSSWTKVVVCDKKTSRKQSARDNSSDESSPCSKLNLTPIKMDDETCVDIIGKFTFILGLKLRSTFHS